MRMKLDCLQQLHHGALRANLSYEPPSQPPLSEILMATVTFAKVDDRRRHERRFVCMPSWMIFYRYGLNKHVGMVRDLNRCGMYFYSSLAPKVGSDLEFVMRFPRWTNLRLVACKGRVLRVEQPKNGAAVGVA